MTGYGQTEASIANAQIKIEIRTLNSKFLDLILRLPKELTHLETEIRSLIQRELKRGKVNLQFELIKSDEDMGTEVNDALLKKYFEKYQQIANELGSNDSDLFRLALQSPDVISNKDLIVKIEWKQLEKPLLQATKSCSEFRKQEGSNLQKNIATYIESIDEKLNAIKELDPERLENIRTRINKNLNDIRERVLVDENRFEQELIYYIEKIDITEEKVRLQRHLNYFNEVMSSKESKGKKLGFISQEIGREINTIGSKANNSDVQQLVVEMKDELEKIKEQLLNIL